MTAQATSRYSSSRPAPRSRVSVKPIFMPGRAGFTPEQGVDAPAERGEGADRDEGVHRRRAVAQVHPGGAVERPAGPQHDRPGEGEGEPLPVGELQRVDHRQQQHRDAEDGGADEPVAQGPDLRVVGGGSVIGGGGRRRRSWDGCRVADGFDLGDEVVDAGVVGDGDGGLFGGVVDAGLDAVELVEPLGDAGGARGAGHAADVEGDGAGRRAGGGGGHRSQCSMSAAPVTAPWSNVNEAVRTVPSCWKSKNRP